MQIYIQYLQFINMSKVENCKPQTERVVFGLKPILVMDVMVQTYCYWGNFMATSFKKNNNK